MPASPTDLLSQLTGAAFALFLILAALNGPKGPPSAPSAQLLMPFMYESPQERKE